MKLSVVLWGALQETLTKVDHLEASVYELQEAMKEFKKQKRRRKQRLKIDIINAFNHINFEWK